MPITILTYHYILAKYLCEDQHICLFMLAGWFYSMPTPGALFNAKVCLYWQVILIIYKQLETETLGAVEYIKCIFAECWDSSNEYLGYDIKKNLIMRLQPRRFGECGVSLHCYCSQVHSDLDWKHLIVCSI